MNLKKAILLNVHSNPELAWQLFKRVLASSPSRITPHLSSCIPTIARLLIDSCMHTELPHLDFLLRGSRPSCLSLVSTLAQHGPFRLALRHFKSLRSYFPRDAPPIRLYNLLFKSCIKEGDLECVTWLYKDMVLSGVSPQTYTFNLLISMLCDSGRLVDARSLFDKMHEKGCEPNEFSFGILVRGYCRAGKPEEGLLLLEDMKARSMLNCVVYNTLVSCFCKLGKTDLAEGLVESMRDNGLGPDVVTFNARISSLCGSGNALEASRILRDMLFDDSLPRPNNITYNLMLKGFFQSGMLTEAQLLIDSMRKNGTLSGVESFNIWISGLMKNGKLLEAQFVLKDMVDSGIQPSIYSYNIMINGLCKNNLLPEARKLMSFMARSGCPPDTVTYTTLLHGYCCRSKVAEACRLIQEMAVNNCLPNAFTCNILLQSLWKEGRLAEADDFLQQMRENDYRVDIVTCNIVIGGLCCNGWVDKAICIFNEMWANGTSALGKLDRRFIDWFDEINGGSKCTPDIVTYTTIVSALCKVGRLGEAKKMYAEMIGRDLQPDSAIYNVFIYFLSKDGKLSSAFRVLKDMERKGCSKTIETYNSLIMGLGSKNQIFEIYGLFNEMKERGIMPKVLTYNNLISSLCEAGRSEDALPVLEEMLQTGVFPNISSFRILIKAFCQVCDFVAVQEVFDIAINVCGHIEAIYSLAFNEILVGGLVYKAKELFESALNRNFDIGNFNYSNLIYKLCHEDKLEEAAAILRMLIEKRYRFDHAAFVPVIEGFNKAKRKQEANELAEKMMILLEENVDKKIHRIRKTSSQNKRFEPRNDGSSSMLRNDGSGIALKTLQQVQNLWGQGTIASMKLPKNNFHDG